MASRSAKERRGPPHPMGIAFGEFEFFFRPDLDDPSVGWIEMGRWDRAAGKKLMACTLVEWRAFLEEADRFGP